MTDLERIQARWVIRNLDQIAHTLEHLEETLGELYSEDDDIRQSYFPNIRTWVAATAEVVLNRHQLQLNRRSIEDKLADTEQHNEELQNEIVDLRRELRYIPHRIKGEE